MKIDNWKKTFYISTSLLLTTITASSVATTVYLSKKHSNNYNKEISAPNPMHPLGTPVYYPHGMPTIPENINLNAFSSCDRGSGPRHLYWSDRHKYITTSDYLWCPIFEGDSLTIGYNTGWTPMNRSIGYRWYFSNQSDFKYNTPNKFNVYAETKIKEQTVYDEFFVSYDVNKVNNYSQGYYGVETFNIYQPDKIIHTVDENPIYQVICCPRIGAVSVSIDNDSNNLSKEYLFTQQKPSIKLDWTYGDNQRDYLSGDHPLVIPTINWQIKHNNKDWETLPDNFDINKYEFEPGEYTLKAQVTFVANNKLTKSAFSICSKEIHISFRESIDYLNEELFFENQHLNINQNIIVNGSDKNDPNQFLEYQWMDYDGSKNDWVKDSKNTKRDLTLSMNVKSKRIYKCQLSFKNGYDLLKESKMVEVLIPTTINIGVKKFDKLQLYRFDERIDQNKLPIYSIYKENGICLLENELLNPDGSYKPLKIDTTNFHSNDCLYLKVYNPLNDVTSVQLLKLNNPQDKVSEVNNSITTSDKEDVHKIYKKLFPWWKIILIIISGFVAIGLSALIVKTIIKYKKRKKIDISD